MENRKDLIAIVNQFFDKKIVSIDELIDDYYAQNKTNLKRSECILVINSFLRYSCEYDQIIDQCTSKKISRSNLIIRNILRMALVELYILKRPEYAVIDSWVEICKQKKRTEPFASFINAILRKIIIEKDKIIISTQHKIPQWLWMSWKQDYGNDIANQITEASLLEPPLDLYCHKENDFDSQFIEIEKNIFRKSKAGFIENIRGFKEGKWWVQDVGASIPAKLFTNIENEEVLDLCSAPGGKAMQMISMGAKVTCVDSSKSRIQLMLDNFNRLKFNPEIINKNIMTWASSKTYKNILLDAPCSATGTIRKHPDLIFLKNKHELSKYIKTQQALLEKAINLLSVNGQLIYCVCSMQKSEGLRQIENLLKKNKNIKRDPVQKTEFAQFEKYITKDGDIQTFPYMQNSGGMDGFFISRLYKEY
tara:strand:- start:90 stop:1352 length:1263 start_codon:yes stop_codon:yes gene_type:complete